MMIRHLFLAGLLAVFTGCESSQRVVFEVVDPEEHLLHNTNEEGLHLFWYDGCRGRVQGSGDTIMIWWMNGAIADAPFSFEKGNTYLAEFDGTFGDDFVEAPGKSLRLDQLLRVERTETSKKGLENIGTIEPSPQP